MTDAKEYYGVGGMTIKTCGFELGVCRENSSQKASAAAGYTGQRNYGDFALMDYHARFYSPKLGRFVQPDTDVPENQGFMAYDRYSYVLNNPTNLIDPSGHIPCEELGTEDCKDKEYSNLDVSGPSSSKGLPMVLSGSELEYNPDFWNNDIPPVSTDRISYGEESVLLSVNCYEYACNFPDWDGRKTGPGRKHLGSNVTSPTSNGHTGQEVVGLMMLDGIAADCKVTSGSAKKACAPGSFKIALVIDPREEGGLKGLDYHYYQQNSSGSWSHKTGQGVVSNLDASGHVIWDPKTADRDYTDGGTNNYSQFVGYYCIGNPYQDGKVD